MSLSAIALFCCLDDFARAFEEWEKQQLVPTTRKRHRPGKLLLRKRFIIEALFDRLKSEIGLEHTRHRSPVNAFVHILSCIAAYMLGKAKVKMSPVDYP